MTLGPPLGLMTFQAMKFWPGLQNSLLRGLKLDTKVTGPSITFVSVLHQWAHFVRQSGIAAMQGSLVDKSIDDFFLSQWPP